MTEEWKNMSDADKRRHEDESNRGKERYEREMTEYKKKTGADK